MTIFSVPPLFAQVRAWLDTAAEGILCAYIGFTLIVAAQLVVAALFHL